jgi:hypothetical protein
VVIHHWQGGIFASGGAIVPEKTHWYLVDYKWKAGIWHYAMVNETQVTLSVQDVDGKMQLLCQLPVEAAK